MKPFKLGFAVALVLAAMPLAASAQDAAEEEASSPWSLSYGATTDYVWRGISQSDENPAFQAGLTYTSPVGVYAGFWGSTVDFGDGGTENDWFLGYNTDIGESFNLDVMYNYYSYPGKKNTGDFGELIVKGTVFDHYSATVAYSDSFANTKGSSVYYALGGEWELPADFGIGVGVGRSTFDSKVGIEDYTDWSVSLSKSFGPATLALGYTDTNVKGDPLADDRFFASITVEVP
ncbi:MAG: TorF family putative porin [Pseudoxanthomonas sp.]